MTHIVDQISQGAIVLVRDRLRPNSLLILLLHGPGSGGDPSAPRHAGGCLEMTFIPFCYNPSR
jgi:hypothetical protein